MHLKKRRRRRVLALLAAAVLTGFVLVIKLRYLPTARRMIAMRIDTQTSNLINDAVEAQIESGQIGYDRLIRLEKDADGAVTALTTDMAEANRLKAGILRELGARIPEMSVEQISVPVGNVVFPSLLSGRGGWIPVGAVALKNANAEFHSELTQAGINQTLHRIVLEVCVQVTVLTPDGMLEQPVRTEVVVAQTVIVGKVPQTVLTFEGD